MIQDRSSNPGEKEGGRGGRGGRQETPARACMQKGKKGRRRCKGKAGRQQAGSACEKKGRGRRRKNRGIL